MEIDSRRLYLGEGCASMFSYCTQVLHLAEGAAYNRIEAARAARSYPLILELFEQSAITLTAVRLLAPHLTAENHAAVLASAQHKSKREIEELVCRVAAEAGRACGRAEASGAARRTTGGARCHGVQHAARPRIRGSSDAATAASALRCFAAAPSTPARIAPLAPERYRIQLTVSRETHDRFRRAQALLRHAVPSGDAAEIFDRAITLLVEGLERQRFAETARPRVSHAERQAFAPHPGGGAASRLAAGWRPLRVRGVRRALPRDRVSRVPPRGAVCRRRRATVENIELRCRAHNAL